ncbi:hypothetical protein RHSIM_Rhsim13G0143400 [Rhododendron simsii]|uniref:Uncharacterized protein n=1 Tax=Rhododendron simsii TaxID=118357 RepID=A0A834L714_RHOSS|nr:hypothetical protein RHSIM_Rhsim13G0143400 [Rhododendron simsii]
MQMNSMLDAEEDERESVGSVAVSEMKMRKTCIALICSLLIAQDTTELKASLLADTPLPVKKLEPWLRSERREEVAGVDTMLWRRVTVLWRCRSKPSNQPGRQASMRKAMVAFCFFSDLCLLSPFTVEIWLDFAYKQALSLIQPFLFDLQFP